ncbi:MAG: glycosyltransferase family 4 protein [Actinomycetota bacterium]|nr:glycosyltransferase family 4 protein [Actinomycetota bacterium]
MTTYYYNLLSAYTKTFSSNKTAVLTVKPPIDSDVPSNEQNYDFPVYRFNRTGSKIKTTLDILLTLPYATKIIKAEKPDILLVGNMRPFAYYAHRFKKKLGIPYIIFFHGMDLMRLSKKMTQSFYNKTFFRNILNSASGFITSSHYAKGLLIKSLNISQERIKVIHPCVNPDKFEPAPDPVNPILLTIARLAPRKGIDTVLHALPKVVKEIPTLSYKIVGKGNIHYYKQLAKQLSIENHVRFYGYCSDTELITHLQNSTLLIMVSKMLENGIDVEGFGIVYLEANACGKPVIAADTGGVREAVEHNYSGLLVPPDDPDATAEALLTLLKNDTLRHKLGEQGRERVMKKFVWDVSAKALDEFLTTLF